MNNVLNVGVGELIVSRGIAEGKEAVFINKSLKKSPELHAKLISNEEMEQLDIYNSVAVFTFENEELANKCANGFFKNDYFG